MLLQIDDPHDSCPDGSYCSMRINVGISSVRNSQYLYFSPFSQGLWTSMTSQAFQVRCQTCLTKQCWGLTHCLTEGLLATGCDQEFDWL